MINRRIDQAVDMGIGAGLMYWLDPEVGSRRRSELQDKVLAQLQMASDALVTAGKQAEDTIVAARKQAEAAIVAAGKQAEDSILAAGKQVQDGVVGAGKQAQGRATAVVPAAKFALFQKLMMDEELRKRAIDALPAQRSFGRRAGWPVTVALITVTAAAIGAGLMYILDPELGARRRAMLRNRLMRMEREKREAMSDLASEAQDRAQGVSSEARSQTSPEQVTNRTF